MRQSINQSSSPGDGCYLTFIVTIFPYVWFKGVNSAKTEDCSFQSRRGTCWWRANGRTKGWSARSQDPSRRGPRSSSRVRSWGVSHLEQRGPCPYRGLGDGECKGKWLGAPNPWGKCAGPKPVVPALFSSPWKSHKDLVLIVGNFLGPILGLLKLEINFLNWFINVEK